MLAQELAYSEGNSTRAGELWEESVHLFRDREGSRATAVSFVHLGMAALDRADYGNASAHLQEGLTLLREMDALSQTALALQVYATRAAMQVQGISRRTA